MKIHKKNKIKLNNIKHIKKVYKKIITVSFSLIIMQIAISSAASAYSSNPIAYWKFDEKTGTVASDSSGNNNNGTISGAAWTVGKINNALNFDGVNDFINAGNKASLQITGPISLEGWIKINDLSVSSSLFGRGHGLGGNGNYGYFLTYYAVTKSLYFDTYSSTKRDALLKTNAILDNNWHHITATWDGTTSSNGKKLYIDGVLIAQKTSAIASMGNPSYNFKIGMDSINYRPAKATIDDVKVYNRALSAPEVAADYNGGNIIITPPKSTETTPPNIAISSPANSQTFTNPSITVSGTASDNVAVSKVEIKLNSGAFQLATGTANWNKPLTLASGSNTITARVTDSSNNIKEASITNSYIPPGSTQPIISAISSSSITSTSATISWTTDKDSDTQVEYGTTTSYGSSTTLNPTISTSHSVYLSGLSASTLYHYRVKSKDASGNLATSQDNTFTTISMTVTPIKLTIDHTKVGAQLSDFPVMVHIGKSSALNSADTSFILAELGSDANRKKIAITTASGTELNVEIEKWDTANKEAWLWVKVPSVSNSQDTVLYLTYDKNRADNTNMVGDIGSTPAKNVWNSGYVAVYHMNDIGSVVKDSTQNAHNGMKKGGTPDPVSGKLGPSALFTGTNYIEVPDHDQFSLVNTRHLIVSTWFSPSALVMSTTDTDDYQIRLLSKTGSNTNEWTLDYHNDGSPRDQGIAWYLCNLAGGLCTGEYMYPYGDSRNNIAVNEWEQLTGRGDEDSTLINGVSRTHWVSTYKNGDYRYGQTLDATAKIVPGNGNAPFVMGHDLSWPNSWLKGKLDEVRIESATRSDAWIKASYSSESDTLLSIS